MLSHRESVPLVEAERTFVFENILDEFEGTSAHLVALAAHFSPDLNSDFDCVHGLDAGGRGAAGDATDDERTD